MQKVAIVTDAWHPQVNGVVRATEAMVHGLRKRGIEVLLIEPNQFWHITVPFYREIQLALFARRKVTRLLKAFDPEAILLQTEGPLGFAAKKYCQKNNLQFTTWYHTHFHFYLDMRMRGLLNLVRRTVRDFHNASTRTLVSSEGLKHDLEAMGITNATVVPLGVDTNLFKRNLAPNVPQYQKPVFIYFSRLAIEKNSEEFFKLNLEGTKLVVGDGPDKKMLEKKYPDATFVGYKTGQELVDYLSLADVMVFPSKTETFGLAALEALACGVPVAAHDLLGPRDIITQGVDGYLGDDLAEAAQKCLLLDMEACRAKALKYSWDHTVEELIKNLVSVK